MEFVILLTLVYTSVALCTAPVYAAFLLLKVVKPSLWKTLVRNIRIPISNACQSAIAYFVLHVAAMAGLLWLLPPKPANVLALSMAASLLLAQVALLVYSKEKDSQSNR